VKSMASGLSSALVLVLEILREHSSRVQSIEDGSFARLDEKGSRDVDETTADNANSAAGANAEGAVGMLRLLFAGLTLDRCLLLLLAAWNLLLQPRRRHSSPSEADTEPAFDSAASTAVAQTRAEASVASHTEQLHCNANTISGATGRRMLRELRATRKERRPDCMQHTPALAAQPALASNYGWDHTATASLRGNLPSEQAALSEVAVPLTAPPNQDLMQASSSGRPFRNSRMRAMKSKRSWHQFQPQPSSDSGEGGDLQKLVWGPPQGPAPDSMQFMQLQSSPSSGEASDAEPEGRVCRNSCSAAAAAQSSSGCFSRRSPAGTAGTSTEFSPAEVIQRNPAAVPVATMVTARLGGHQRTLTATSQESASQACPPSPQSSRAAAPIKRACAGAGQRLPKRYSSAARRHILSQQQRATAAAESCGGSASGGYSPRYHR